MQTDTVFAEHNTEVKEVWSTFHAENPIRVPMVLGISARFLLSDPVLNPEGITYYDYHNDPETMLKVQLQLQDFIRHHIWADHEMGLPQEWKIGIDGGTFHHSAWYGSDVHYSVDSPDTKPLLNDDNKHMLFDRGIPDPFSGLYGTFKNFYEYFQDHLHNYSYKGRPVSPNVAVPAATAEGNGVPFTTACKVRGTTALCMDMVTDPEYAKKLLEYITEAAIARIKAWKKYLHVSGPAVIFGGDHAIHEKSDFVMLGDDSVILLSPEMYREFVLPCHQRLYEKLGSPSATRGIHLCGSAGKHFRIMEKELYGAVSMKRYLRVKLENSY
ncbi:MAG: hypothetical protein GY801_18200 [bacterium]|nr:hypothetical protein [bacterium]